MYGVLPLGSQTIRVCKLSKFSNTSHEILYPLLFIIYMNDIPEIASFAKFIFYADDANIILIAPTIAEVFEQLET